jgi:hypothetical protein
MSTKHIAETALQASDFDQRYALGLVEFSQQIHIGYGRGFIPCHRPKYMDVKDSRSLKLELVVAELFDNEALIHDHILRQDGAFLKKDIGGAAWSRGGGSSSTWGAKRQHKSFQDGVGTFNQFRGGSFVKVPASPVREAPNPLAQR